MSYLKTAHTRDSRTRRKPRGRSYLAPILALATSIAFFVSACSLISRAPEKTEDPADQKVSVAVDAASLPLDEMAPLVQPAGQEEQPAQKTETKAKGSAPLVRKGIGKTISYVTRKDDTLMKVAFATLGNAFRWREIYQANSARLPNPSHIPAGITLQIDSSGAVTPKRQGQAYLIQKRDTLWKISERLYRTPWKWSALWKNNLELIHDPHWIYAGFNLYYAPKAEAPAPAAPILAPKILGSADGAPASRSLASVPNARAE